MARVSSPLVERPWSHGKQRELPNFCPTAFGQLRHYARSALKRLTDRKLTRNRLSGSLSRYFLQGCTQPITLPSKIRPFSSLNALK
jgi:hypothetical protein